LTSLLVLALFVVIDQMTASPVTISGNGNPALLIAIFLLPLFIKESLWPIIERL